MEELQKNLEILTKRKEEYEKIISDHEKTVEYLKPFVRKLLSGFGMLEIKDFDKNNLFKTKLRINQSMPDDLNMKIIDKELTIYAREQSRKLWVADEQVSYSVKEIRTDPILYYIHITIEEQSM